MPRRQPLPRLWLMTDERMGAALWAALDRLPRGSGVVFRHYATADRAAVFVAVRRVARRRGLVLMLSDTRARAAAWRADGVHGPAAMLRPLRPMLRSIGCHSRRELIAARGIDVRFLSPFFATRSHPGVRPLGMARAGLAMRGESGAIVALGGMTQRRGRAVERVGSHGWAAIDALAP